MTKRRFASFDLPAEGTVKGLRTDHPAVVEARSIFPKSVVAPGRPHRVLVSGEQQRKIGARIAKGPWRGLPVYCLTLEERASCPRSCLRWFDCYGNAMRWARRNIHGPALEACLLDEVAALAQQHPRGFAVRLHVLGDFYSSSYALLWSAMLRRHPGLHLFGFTAHHPNSNIGDVVASMNRRLGTRCAIRFSQASAGPMAAVVVDSPEQAPPGAVLCPQQTDKTLSCGSCGLCWATEFRDRTIVFQKHGMTGRRPGSGPRQNRKGADVELSTTVPKELRVAFKALAEAEGSTPATKLREMVEREVGGQLP